MQATSEEALEILLLDQKEQVLQPKILRYAAPQLGDLVLRRRFQVDKSLGIVINQTTTLSEILLVLLVVGLLKIL